MQVLWSFAAEAWLMMMIAFIISFSEEKI